MDPVSADERPSWSEMLQSADLNLPAILLSSARFDQPSDEPAAQKHNHNPGERTMTYALIRRLVSTKTLLRVGFAALSLHATGAAFAQGLSAGTTAPMYATTWAATRSQSHSLTAQNMVSESAKTARAEAPRTADNKIRLFSHRTGG
jgi:hypothetical protein